MKKSFIFVVVLLLLASCFISCEKTRAYRLSDESFNLGIAAVEIVDDYLSQKITLDEAVTRISINYNTQKSHVEYERDLYNVTLLYGTTVSQDENLLSATNKLMKAMKDKFSGIGSDSAIKENRKELAGAVWR